MRKNSTQNQDTIRLLIFFYMSVPHPSQFQSRMGMAQTVSRRSITADTRAWHKRLVVDLSPRIPGHGTNGYSSIYHRGYPGMAQTVSRRSITADTRAWLRRLVVDLSPRIPGHGTDG